MAGGNLGTSLTQCDFGEKSLANLFLAKQISNYTGWMDLVFAKFAKLSYNTVASLLVM